MGVWLLAGSWSADNLTDGFIPATILPRWGRPRDATRLVEVGLWHADEQDGEKGWRFHEWSERQPSRAQKLAEREVRAEAGRIGGLRSGRSRREANPKQVASPVLEPPTRPDPNPSKRGEGSAPAAAPTRKRVQHQIPEDFAPNDTNRRLAEEQGITDLAGVLVQFKDHHQGKGTTMKDWHLAFNTWIRRERPTPRPANVRTLPYVSQLESPPSGLSEREYSEWLAARR